MLLNENNENKEKIENCNNLLIQEKNEITNILRNKDELETKLNVEIRLLNENINYLQQSMATDADQW